MPNTTAAATLATASAAAGIAQRRGKGTTFGRSARAVLRIRCSSVSGSGGRSTAYASATAVSRNEATSSWQRSHLARWASYARRSSASSASSAYAAASSWGEPLSIPRRVRDTTGRSEVVRGEAERRQRVPDTKNEARAAEDGCHARQRGAHRGRGEGQPPAGRGGRHRRGR